MTKPRRITIQDWITDALQDADKGAPCSHLGLFHIRGMGVDEVHTKPLQGPQDYKKLADFFTAKACAYAQDMTGIQSFRLQAFYGTNEPRNTHTFTVVDGQLTAGENVAYSKFEPTPTGLLGQLMKSLENTNGQMMQFTQGMVGMLMQSFSEHQKEKAEMHMIMRDVLLSQRKEAHDMQMSQLKFQRESEERQMIGRMLPSAVNYLTGKEVLPDALGDSLIVEQMALKFTPNDLQMLVSLGKISQEQAMMLAARFTKIREEHEKRQKSLATAPAEDPPKAAE